MIEFTPELVEFRKALNNIPVTRENDWTFVSALDTFKELCKANFKPEIAAYVAYGYTLMCQAPLEECEEMLEILKLRYVRHGNEFCTITADRIAMENGTEFKIK